MISTNILVDREPFIGRRKELEQLEGALRAGERLIVIMGLAGMGKARLARQVVQQLGPELAPAGGVWSVDAAGLETRAALLQAVAMALGVQLGGSQRALETRVLDALSQRGPLLLVLADCESLDRGAFRMVQGWLDRAPALRILATSLIHLDLEGEFLFELGPLEPAEAVALYEDRAGRAWADRSFVAGERQSIAELVERLDRIPLAIELAAGRVRVLPPRAMLLRIENRFELLQSRRAGDGTSLEKAIGLSWARLEADEQAALAQASVFAGGFSLEAAEAVIEVEDSEHSVVELLEGLRKKGLLGLDQVEEEGEAEGEGERKGKRGRAKTAAPDRFQLYESVRAYAARELEQSEAGEAPSRRHAAYYLRCGTKLLDRLEKRKKETKEELLAAFAPNRENWIVARERLGAEGKAEPEALARLDSLLEQIDAWIEATAPPPPEPEVQGSIELALPGQAGIQPNYRSGIGHLQLLSGDGDASEEERSKKGLEVGPDAVWFQVTGQPRVPLERRGAQRRLLQALVENRLLAPGQGLSLEQMARAGWPGEAMSPSAAANRVYNSVNGLRKAGLGAMLERRPEGYLLSPELPVTRVRE